MLIQKWITKAIWAKTIKDGQKPIDQKVVNERLQQVLKQAKGIKPFNYDNVFRENNELEKQHSLLKVKLKALTMEEKDVDLWWDAVQDIVQKDIGKVYKMYKRNEKLYMHKISRMEKVIPFFQYEPLVLTLESKTLDEEEERGQTDGVGPSKTRTIKEEPVDLKGGRDSSQKEAKGMKNVSKQILKPLEYIPHEFNSQEYVFATTEIG